MKNGLSGLLDKLKGVFGNLPDYNISFGQKPGLLMGGSILPSGYQISTPTPTPYSTPTPTPTPYSTPTPTPNSSGGFHIPNVPDNIAQVLGSVMVGQGKPMDATASAQILKHDYGPQIKGMGRGENPDFKTVLDTVNRINSKGNWDSSAPIKQIVNPFTGQSEDSIDRGLWRVNNETFYDYQRRFPGLLKGFGINSYDDMNDPIKNTIMGKLILQYQGGQAYKGAPASMAGFGKLH